METRSPYLSDSLSADENSSTTLTKLSKFSIQSPSSTLLRDAAMCLDPLDTAVAQSMDLSDQSQFTWSAASTAVSESPNTSDAITIRSKHNGQIPRSLLNHLSTNPQSSIPQQSLAKAFASIRKPASPTTFLGMNLADGSHRLPSFTQLPPAAVSDLRATTITSPMTRFASLHSPCFFHKRFDDAVNIDRVLEEISVDDGMSHGRLMQTATSVREISKQLQRRPIKRAVRSIMVVTKARDNSLIYLTRELAIWLLSTPRYGKDVGVNVYVDAKLRNSKRFDSSSILSMNPSFASMLRYWDPDMCWSSPEKFDLVLTLGGDGTVLFTSFSLFQRIVPPVLAFSLGSLGFLTNFAFTNYKSSLDNILGDAGMRVNLRMRFTCTVFRAPQNVPRGGAAARKFNPIDTAAMVEGEQFEVLNELVIDRGPSPYVSNLELYGDDELLTVVQADGCILATPTGSTAYSLSAGGPLTHPSIPGLVLTPICPHTLSFRPMVLSDSMLLKVCVPRGSRSTAYASFDGKHRVELRRGDCIQVEAGRYPFPTVVGAHGTGGEWFESVRRALRWNTRGAMQKAFDGSKEKKEQKDKAHLAEESCAPDEMVGLKPVAEDDNDDIDEDVEEEEEEEDEWDIDFEPIAKETEGQSVTTDSGLGASERSSTVSSPRRSISRLAF